MDDTTPANFVSLYYKATNDTIIIECNTITAITGCLIYGKLKENDVGETVIADKCLVC